MADIVIGIASSHTPQLSSGVDLWPDHALRDQRYPLLGKDASYHTYEETLAGADPRMAEELKPEVWESKYQRVQAAIESLAAALKVADADLALVIGDDQRELFVDDGIPAFACFTGTELFDMAPDAEAFASWLLSDFQREGRTVMVAPGAGFYATPGLGMDEVRIAYVLNLDDIKDAMDVLRAGLAAYPHRR